jgi:hypothetical protein
VCKVGTPNPLIAPEMEKWSVKRGTWCGVNASVACSATIIVRPLDAAQYCNHTGEFAKYWDYFDFLQAVINRARIISSYHGVVRQCISDVELAFLFQERCATFC